MRPLPPTRAPRPPAKPPARRSSDMAKGDAAETVSNAKTLRGRLHSIASLNQLGPGLITGAADDDPSGIATYSQGGAQFGFGLLWTLVLTFPLMAAIQLVSAHIGRITGQGLARNMMKVMPRQV